MHVGFQARVRLLACKRLPPIAEAGPLHAAAKSGAARIRATMGKIAAAASAISARIRYHKGITVKNNSAIGTSIHLPPHEPPFLYGTNRDDRDHKRLSIPRF